MPQMFLVDAFSATAFQGNTAGVCLLDAAADAAWMQRAAIEINHETAFVSRVGSGGDGFALRWFTPVGESEICGHATIASAHVLWEQGWLPQANPAVFNTRAGVLTAQRQQDQVVLELPADPPVEAEAPDGLISVFGARPLFFGRGKFYWIARFADESQIRALKPEGPALARVAPEGIICTARATGRPYDVFSRFFTPVMEDTVTGSSACLLGPYWTAELGGKPFVARQEHGATGRGGSLSVALDGERVKIGGQAVTTLAGRLVD